MNILKPFDHQLVINKVHTEKELLELLKTQPEKIGFDDLISVVEKNYSYTPTAFINGKEMLIVSNDAGKNEGSCKVFGFAKLHQLSVEQSLHCFGDFYRKDVLENPKGNDHQNIRAFIQHGWEGIKFDGAPLTAKK